MILKKWNYQKNEYEPYEVPNDWNFVFFTSDMNTLTTCPHCGKKVPFGDTYTSMEIHTNTGFGFFVCEECYEEEMERRR